MLRSVEMVIEPRLRFHSDTFPECSLTVCGPGGTKVPFLYGIRVNCIYPGPVATPLRAKNYPNEDPSTITSPEEVARVILFLSCDESAAINGADIDVAWKGQDILPTIRTPKS